MSDGGMNDADRRAIAHLRDAIPLTFTDYELLGECSELGQAALLLGVDESAIVAWYDAAASEPSPIARLLSRIVDREDVAARVDTEFARDRSILRDLVRAQITWMHPALGDLLEQADSRSFAAWMLAQVEPERLIEWLDDERDASAVVDVAVGAAPSGVAELFDAFAEWVDPIRDAAPRLMPRLEAALFVLAPGRWGRGYVVGDYDGTFLVDPIAMAEIIGHTTDTFATDVLATLLDAPGDLDADQFEAAARVATAGIAACLLTQPEEYDAIAQAFDDEGWAALSGHCAFAVAVALAEEEDHLPLVESAVHDVLVYAGEMMRPPVRALGTEAPESAEDAETGASQTGGRDIEELTRRAQRDDVIALAAIRALADEATEESASVLIDLWADGPPLRSPFVSSYVYEVLVQLD